MNTPLLSSLPRARGRRAGFWLCLLLSLLASLQALAQVATVYTDRADYLPGDIVVIEGNGWQAGEEVRLEIDHSTVSHGNTVLTALADPNGHIYNDQFVIQPIHLGESFTLVATGQSSGLTARTAFTDGNIQGVAVSAASAAATYGTSAQIDYTVTITKTGGGADITASLSLAGQPAGATYAFTPGSVVLGNGTNATKTVNLRITTNTAKVNAGGTAYSFTVRATNADASVDYKEGNGQLLINRRATTATLTGTVTKTYDGTVTAALTPANYTLSGVLTSDAVSVGTTAGLYANATAGTGKTVSVTGLTLSGADAGNYALSSSAASGPVGVISARPVAGSFTAAGKTYDGGTGASVLTRSLTGAVSGDDVSLSGGTATFATKQAGPAKSVTLSGATLGGTKAGNYTLSSVAPATAAIDTRPLTISATGVSRPYDGTTAASVTLQDNRVTNDVLVPTYAAATFTTPDAGADRPVSVSGITLGGSDAPNYTFNTAASTTATIARRPLTVAADPQSKTYGDPDPALTYQAPGLIGSDQLTGALTRTSGENAGSGYLIQQGSLASANYVISFAGASFAITARPVTIAPTAGQRKTYGDADPAFDFAPVMLVGSDALSGQLGRVPGETVAVGPYDFTLGTLTAGPNYALSFGSTPAQFTITPKSLTPTVAVLGKEYDGTTAATITGRALAGVNGGDDVTLTGGTAAFADQNAGLGKLVHVTGLGLSGAAAANYHVPAAAAATADITPRTLAPAYAAADKTYDATTAATLTGVVLSGGLSGDDVDVSGGTASFADRHVGTGKTVTVAGVSLTGAAAGNYQLPAAALTTTATITARPLTVTGLSANSRSYDGTLVAGLSGTPALQNVPAAETPGAVLLSGTAVGAFASAGVGAGKAVTVTGLTLSGTAPTNYTLTLPSTLAADIRAQTLTPAFTAADKPYDGTTGATITTRSVAGVVPGETVTLTGGAATFDTKNVGPGKTVTASGFGLSGAASGNYVLATAPATTTAGITAVQLTPHITAAGKAYDGTTAATLLSQSVAGMVSGETAVELVVGSQSFDDARVGTRTVTASGLSLSGAQAGNYQLAPGATATAPASITAKALTAAVGASDKDYDGSPAATLNSRTLAGVVGHDAVMLTVGTATFDNKNAGTGKTVTATGLTLSGADAGNYSLPLTTASTTASIRRRALLVEASGGDKVYDGTATATVTLGDNRVGGDVLTATYQAAHFADKHAGAGKTVTVSGIALSGADADNYTANATATAPASISRRALSIGATGQDKTYDGTTVATVVLGDDRVAGDALTTTYAAALFDDAGVGQNKTVSVSGIGLGGADAGNYTANITAGTTADITRRGLLVTADAQTKVYGAPDPALSYQTTGLLGADALSGSLSRAAGETVGAYAIGQGSLANANYSISFTGANLSITAKTITGTFAADNKTYDGSAAATIGTRTLLGVLPGDVGGVSLSGGAAAFADKHAGQGKTVTGTGFGLTGPAAGNYALGSVAPAQADILPKSVTGSIAAADKVYDGSAAAQLTARTLNGVIGNDDAQLTGGAASFADQLVGAGKTVTATGLAISGAEAGNYTLGAVGPAQASITAKALTASITAPGKVYDGTPAASIDGRTLAGVVGNDAVTLTGGTATFDNKNVGTGKTVTATGLTLSGADAGNYSLPLTTASTTASITAKGLVIGITANDKVYDRNRTAAAAASISSGLVPGDAVDVTATNGQFDTKDAGTGKPVTANVGKSGADAGNYTANATATTTAAITPKPLTAGITANDKVYDGTTAATLSAVAITPATDVISPDQVTVTATAPLFDLPTVGSRTVTAGVVLGGADAGNYQLTAATASAPASITERAVTVTATANQGKVYGAPEPPLTYGISAGALAPGDAFSGQLGRAPGQNAGSYAIGLGTLALNANYLLTLTPGAFFVITPKPLTPTIAASNKTYDGTAAASVTPQPLLGLVGNDAVLLEANGSNSFASKTAGLGKTVTATGLTISGAAAPNYALSTTTGTTLADILPKALAGSITADNKVYDGTPTATISSRTLTGVVAADAVNLTGGTAAFDNKNVGLGKPVTATGLTLSGADVGNYSLPVTSASTTATITAKATAVTPAAAGKEYGTPDPALTGTLTGFVGLDNVTAAYSRIPGENVGGSPYTIAATLSPAAALSNYNITYNTAPFTIGQAELTVTATSVGGQYSQPKPTFGVSFSGFRNGDNASVVSGTAAFACPAAFSNATPATVTSPAGTYAITPSVGTLSAPNYRFRFVAGTLTVTEETGLVSYTGQTYFATASPTSATAAILLTAQAQDDPDGSRGDIVSNAVVDFRTDVTTTAAPFLNQAINLNRPIGYISAGVGTEGLATSATLSYTLTGSEVNQSGTTLTVAPVLNAKNGRYYTGAAAQPTTVTITIPGQDNVSGGGFVVPTNSVGQYASAPGSKTNFGFTMKYNNSGRNLQGQANIIVRSGAANYQFKSNAINSLTLSDYKPGATVLGKRAVFNTKANLTNLTTGASLGGNLDLTVEVVQATVAGGRDMVSIRVTDAGSNLLYANNWTGTKAELQNLDGGKISVRSGAAAREVTPPTSTAQQLAPDAVAATVTAARPAQLPGRPSLTASPNPFAERALIEVDFSADDAYRLDLYDVRGALLKHLQAGTARAGAHLAVPCDNAGLPAGLYLVRLTTKYGVQHLRLVRE